MAEIQWGVLGTAKHGGDTWIPAAFESASGTVRAVASRDADRARAFADEQNIPVSYGSYEDLLADAEIDAVYIPLPNTMHKEWAIKAAQAGKHVMCEKPLGLNAAEAEEMVAVFAEAGLKFAEAFQWRHDPQAQRTREIVQNKEIGDLRLIDAGFSFFLDRPGDIRRNPATGGGALYDVGCYTITAARFLAGAEPLRVTAQIRWGATGIDETVVATLEFPGEVLAHLNCSFEQPLRRYYEAVGTKGSAYVAPAYNPKEQFASTVTLRGADREPTSREELGVHNEYVLLIEDFNRAILDDRDPLFPATDAILNMRVIDAIFKAAKEGRTVEVGS